MKRWCIFLLSILGGALLAVPEATSFEVSMPTPRLTAAVTFLCVAVLLSLLQGYWQRKSRSTDAMMRGVGFLVGAALCFGVIRQQATLLVWSALWAVPGSFFGAWFSRFLFERVEILEPKANFTRVAPEGESSCAL